MFSVLVLAILQLEIEILPFRHTHPLSLVNRGFLPLLLLLLVMRGGGAAAFSPFVHSLIVAVHFVAVALGGPGAVHALRRGEAQLHDKGELGTCVSRKRGGTYGGS